MTCSNCQGRGCFICANTVKNKKENALNTQIGGDHYKHFKIQPFEFFHANQLPFHKADVIKRIMRYDQKGGKGLEDLNKIKHIIDMVIELESPALHPIK